jgi:hypothetical protein
MTADQMSVAEVILEGMTAGTAGDTEVLRHRRAVGTA